MPSSGFRRFLSVFSIVISFLGIGAMVAGTYLLIMHQNPDDLLGYVPAKCTLTRAQAMNYGECGYLATWRNDDAVGSTVLATPFGMVPTEAEANLRIAVYPLNTPLDCMCDPAIRVSYPAVLYGDTQKCTIWGASCFLDTRLVSHIQTQSQGYVELAEILMTFSGATTLLCIAIGLINCICGGAIDSCCFNCEDQGCCRAFFCCGCCRKRQQVYSPLHSANGSYANESYV